MIFSQKGDIRIDTLESIDFYTEEDMVPLVEAEEASRLNFMEKPGLETNHEKQLYKIGFLFEFLKKVHPKKKQDEICKIMSDRYQVYLGQRQIERKAKAYLKKE